ncbi:hypothetical protein D030_1232B, partial [Vibrio parahaemolyticus AQ3810]
QDK